LVNGCLTCPENEPEPEEARTWGTRATLGALWSLGTATAAFWTLISVHALGLGVFAMNQIEVWPLHYTMNVTIMTMVSAAIFVGLSLLIEDDTDPEDASLWSREAAFDTDACNAGFSGMPKPMAGSSGR